MLGLPYSIDLHDIKFVGDAARKIIFASQPPPRFNRLAIEPLSKRLDASKVSINSLLMATCRGTGNDTIHQNFAVSLNVVRYKFAAVISTLYSVTVLRVGGFA